MALLLLYVKWLAGREASAAGTTTVRAGQATPMAPIPLLRGGGQAAPQGVNWAVELEGLRLVDALERLGQDSGGTVNVRDAARRRWAWQAVPAIVAQRANDVEALPEAYRTLVGVAIERRDTPEARALLAQAWEARPLPPDAAWLDYLEGFVALRIGAHARAGALLEEAAARW